MIFDDITVRKQAEEELQRSENGLAEAQRIAHIGNWHYDVGRDRAYWPDELYRIFGLTPQQFIPTYRSFLDFVHPEDSDWWTPRCAFGRSPDV